MIGELRNFSLFMTGKVAVNLLFVELYFLFRAGKSPFFFNLSDFIDRFSIELVFIALVLFLFSGFLTLIFMSLYLIIFSPLEKARSFLLRRVKISGIPVFAALREREVSGRVELQTAKDFAFRNRRSELTARIEKWEKEWSKKAENETLVVGAYGLLLLIIFSSSSDTPNFLMGVIDAFFDSEGVYRFAIMLLAVQAIIGRVTSYYIFRDAAWLPVDFFISETERKEAEAWSSHRVTKFD